MARLLRKQVVGQLGAEEQVLLHRQLRHQREFLEHGADAESACLMHRGEVDGLPAELDAAGGRPVDAGHQRDQRRFAGAVLAEQHMHLARPQVEIDAVERDHAREVLGYLFEFGAGPEFPPAQKPRPRPLRCQPRQLFRGRLTPRRRSA